MEKELLEVVEKRKLLEVEIKQAKADFEASIEVKKEIYQELADQELRLRQEVLANMIEKGIDKMIADDKVITYQQKITKVIDNAAQLRKTILVNADKLKETNINIKTFIDENFADEVVVINKANVNELINQYNDLLGENPLGVEDRITDYITIANNK